MADYQNLMPKGGFNKGNVHHSPADSLQFGTHSSLGASSKHKKMVSGVLHLKKESIGAKAHPTAFKVKGAKAFNTKVWHG